MQVVKSSDRKTREFQVPGGLSLKADVMGPAEGCEVVLLHGGGQTRGSWKETTNGLAKLGYRVYACDLRGHGESDFSPQGDYTLDAFASDLRSVIHQLRGKPVLIGASLGGIISLLVAGESDNPIATGLVLVDVAVQTNPHGVGRIQRFMTDKPDGFESIEEAAESVARYASHRSRPGSTKGLERNLRKVDGRYFWHWDPSFLDSWLPSYAAAGQRLESAARNLRIPTMLVHASRSDVIGEEEVRHLLDLAPHAEYTRVEDASHMVVGDRNSRFNQAIVNFLTTHTTRDERA